MKPNTEMSLILLCALGVDIFLIWLAKSKLVKIMWACFGISWLLIGFMVIIRDYLRNDLLLFLAGVTAAFFITGIILAYT